MRVNFDNILTHHRWPFSHVFYHRGAPLLHLAPAPHRSSTWPPPPPGSSTWPPPLPSVAHPSVTRPCAVPELVHIHARRMLIGAWNHCNYNPILCPTHACSRIEGVEVTFSEVWM